MRIDVTAEKLELTDPLKVFIDEKIGSIEKYIKRFDDGTLRIHVDIGRTTKHHQHGDVYKAEINLHLPKKQLTAHSEDVDVRAAIIKAKKILAREIRKYKTTRTFRRN